jgi:RNA polymerase sigma factor (sigma-70 family)
MPTRDEIIEQFYKKNRDMFVKRITYATGGYDNAEDVVQQAFTDALTYFHSFKFSEDSDVEEKFGKWFNTILKNAVRRFRKSEQLGTNYDINDNEEYVESVEMDLHPERMLKLVGKELQEFTTNERQIEALDLLFLKGYSYSVVSQITEYSYKTLRDYASYFRKYLYVKYPDEVLK